AMTSPATQNAIVFKIQQALRKTGLYKGPLDGKYGPATREAIRRYQKLHGLKIDGRISEKLADLLDTGSKVDSLLRRIDRTRNDSIRSAREALSSRPETQHLLKRQETERADPLRDANGCFRKPAAACLLREAAESAKAIYKNEMRDWALGELLVAQTKAGLAEEAVTTTRRIQDPRLIMVALKNIAEAQAVANRVDDALITAETIPDPLRKAEAYIAIARIQSKQEETGHIFATIARLHKTLETVDDPLKQLFFLTRAAAALAEAGYRQKARTYLQEAETLFQEKLSGDSREVALRYIAIAFADIDQPQRALSMIKDIRDVSERTPVLVRMATAQARTGETTAAVSTAKDISTLRYRAVVLSQIAVDQAKRHDTTQAWRTIHMASDAAQDIKLPFARSFAYSNISRAFAVIGATEGPGSPAFAKASEAIEKTTDDRLRAQGFWFIALQHRLAGDIATAQKVQDRAEKETRELKSLLSKIWMFNDIAEEYLKSDEKIQAGAILDKAIHAARDITNAWERTRALAKVAEMWLIVRTNGFRTAQRLP
ncbi:MAG: peptidoglycan-binding domain-containing protein, partial [Rhodospirillales bacterium]